MSSGSAAPQQTTLHTNCCVFIYCRTLDCPHTWPPVGTHPRSNTLMYRSRRVRSKPVLQNWRRGRAPPPSRPPGNHGNGKAAEGLRVHTCPCIAVQEAAAPPSWPGWSFCAPSQDPGSQLQGTLPLLGVLQDQRMLRYFQHHSRSAAQRSTARGRSPHLPHSLNAWHPQCLSLWGRGLSTLL